MKGAAIIRQVLIDHQIGRDDFFGRYRDRHFVAARTDAAKRLRAAGFSFRRCSKLMKRNLDTIRFYVDPNYRAYKAEYYRGKWGMRFLDAGTREVVIQTAKVEDTTPEIIIAQWVAGRAEYEACERASAVA